MKLDEGFPPEKVRAIIEAALLSADGPVPLDDWLDFLKMVKSPQILRKRGR